MNTSTSLVFYRLDINDEIAFDPLRIINTNIGDTRRTGFITDANYSPIDQLNLGFNFSYVNADVVEGPLTGLDIPFVAEHTFNLYSSYQFKQHLSGYFEVLGISERTTVGDFFNTVQLLAGHVTTNLNLSYNRGPISAGFKINNILDTEYRDNAQIGFGPAPTFIPETTFFPAPERNFLFTLSYNYD
jgi:iron complex outermembrane receptor protein